MDHGARAFERLDIPRFLKFTAHLLVIGAVAAAETLHRALRLFLEVRFATVEVVESAGRFTREFHVCNLILADRDVGSPIDQNVGAL